MNISGKHCGTELEFQVKPRIKCLLPQINNVLLWKIYNQSFGASICIDPEQEL